MTNEMENGPSYTMGYSDEFIQLLERRSVETHCGYLEPYLKPGIRVLDLGCGPGNLSVGIAGRIHPAELHGIDREEAQIDIARAAAAAGDHQNAVFHVGDALDLPFPDNDFDLVHCHAVVMHIPETRPLLTEIRRVLKPEGLIACRDMIGSSCFFEPDLGSLSGAWEAFERLLSANGGHPQMGKEIKAILHDAGFSGIRASASFEVFSEPEDLDFFHDFVIDWFFSPEVVGAATRFGLATNEQFDEWRTLLQQWKIHPGAFGTIAWGEAVASNP